jgi:hypothetical protein
MFFCIRDDDTSFFTSPDELESAYGEVTRHGPVSLAIIPFCRAGTSRWVPQRYRQRWSVHPLNENQALVEYLRRGIADGRYEAMLHGYHHDEAEAQREFVSGSGLEHKVRDGKRYLEELLHTKIRVFVPPHNAISKKGLEAISQEGLHLGGTAGLRSGWPALSLGTWATWLRLRKWHISGGAGIPWILDLGDHREIAGNPVTPESSLMWNEAVFENAMKLGGVFCAATHYWELGLPTMQADTQSVGDHLHRLIERAKSDPRVVWRSVGDILTGTPKTVTITNQAIDRESGTQL